MKKAGPGRRLTVCLLSLHPLVFSELERLLPQSTFRLLFKQLDSTLAPELRSLQVPRAPVYVVDGNLAHPALEALVSGILERFEEARVVVVAEKFSEPHSFALLRMGIKGLVSYADIHDQLQRALPLVAAGGFWVPRSALSRFVDSILNGAQGRRLSAASATALSRREQEVLSALLENLSNKEIANRLYISERTVKFHVSNLLSKFGVRRRADLILLCYQRRPVPA